MDLDCSSSLKNVLCDYLDYITFCLLLSHFCYYRHGCDEQPCTHLGILVYLSHRNGILEQRVCISIAINVVKLPTERFCHLRACWQNMSACLPFFHNR